MRIIVMTGDEYKHLTPLFFYFFYKNFCKKITTITYLGFSSPPSMYFDYSNFDYAEKLSINFVKLGDQKDFFDHKTGYWRWSDAVLPFFRKLKDEYFFLTWLEHLPILPADIELFNKLYMLLKLNKAQKAICDTHLNTGKFAKGTFQLTKDIVSLGQETQYRTTLMPSIWKKSYFMRYLKPGMTAWDFEVKNMKESFKDGATILAPAKKNAYTIFNFYIKGLFNQGGFNAIEQSLDPTEKRNILDIVDRFGKQIRFR